MDKYKIKDLAERLQKEKTTELKNKMLFMWIKQDVISLKEYNKLVKLILYGVVVRSEQLPPEYKPCGGCGAEKPNERCINCFHDFGGN